MKRKVTKEPKIALCRACHGTGIAGYTVYRTDSDTLRGRTESAERTCPQCGGSGRVMVSAVIEMEIVPYSPG